MNEEEAWELIQRAMEDARRGMFPCAELDWFAIDDDDCLAVMMNAGQLPVPEPVLAAPRATFELSRLVALLDPPCELLPDDWRTYAARGLFVFGWNATDEDHAIGRYSRLAAPSSGHALVSALGLADEQASDLFRFAGRFAVAESLVIVRKRR